VHTSADISLVAVNCPLHSPVVDVTSEHVVVPPVTVAVQNPIIAVSTASV